MLEVLEGLVEEVWDADIEALDRGTSRSAG